MVPPGIQWTLSHNSAQKLILFANGTIGVTTIVALLCGGTIAGAIACGIGYGVIAGQSTIGAGALSYCDRTVVAST